MISSHMILALCTWKLFLCNFMCLLLYDFIMHDFVAFFVCGARFYVGRLVLMTWPENFFFRIWKKIFWRLIRGHDFLRNLCDLYASFAWAWTWLCMISLSFFIVSFFKLISWPTTWFLQLHDPIEEKSILFIWMWTINLSPMGLTYTKSGKDNRIWIL